jgi:hypothetical protein
MQKAAGKERRQAAFVSPHASMRFRLPGFIGKGPLSAGL